MSSSKRKAAEENPTERAAERVYVVFNRVNAADSGAGVFCHPPIATRVLSIEENDLRMLYGIELCERVTVHNGNAIETDKLYADDAHQELLRILLTQGSLNQLCIDKAQHGKLLVLNYIVELAPVDCWDSIREHEEGREARA